MLHFLVEDSRRRGIRPNRRVWFVPTAKE